MNDDIISRKMAIDTLIELTTYKTKREIVEQCNKCVVDEVGWLGGVAECLDEIEDLPAAQQWIPCSKRLPKESEYEGNVRKYYLIQTEYGDMLVAHYNKVGWTPMYALNAIGDEVVAWMPLPDAYQGVEDGSD